MTDHGDSSRLTTYTRDGLTFNVEDSGPIDGEIVVCLHGFPQPASSWRRVANELAGHGFRVLAPNQRGYSPAARPVGRRAYTLDALGADVLAIADELGVERIHLVGHDWGGIVAWHIAAQHPERLATVTVLSTPHPRAFVESIVRSSQLAHSLYMLAFQVPKLPETLFRLSGNRGRAALEKSGLQGYALDETLRLLTQPETARGMLNWYRALPLSATSLVGHVVVPTAYMWGTDDQFLGRCAAERTARWVTGPYEFVELPGAGHWLPENQAAKVAEVITALANTHSSKAPAAH